MVQRTYRVPADLYERAQARADQREENLSDIIRTALENYADGESR